MTSFQISVSPHRRVAARFVGGVRRALLRAFEQTPEVSQTTIAETLGVHRSVISRQLRGQKDISMGRAAEIAFAMGYDAVFGLEKKEPEAGSNVPLIVAGSNPFSSIKAYSSSATVSNIEPKVFVKSAPTELAIQDA